MARDRLERTQSVVDVFETLAAPAAPPLKGLPPGAWGLASKPAARLMSLATVGLLPATLQRKLGVGLTPAQSFEFRAAGRAARMTTPLLPPPLKNFGPTYLKWRRAQIARGDVGSLEQNPHLAGSAKPKRRSAASAPA